MSVNDERRLSWHHCKTESGHACVYSLAQAAALAKAIYHGGFTVIEARCAFPSHALLVGRTVADMLKVAFRSGNAKATWTEPRAKGQQARMSGRSCRGGLA